MAKSEFNAPAQQPMHKQGAEVSPVKGALTIYSPTANAVSFHSTIKTSFPPEQLAWLFIGASQHVGWRFLPNAAVRRLVFVFPLTVDKPTDG